MNLQGWLRGSVALPNHAWQGDASAEPGLEAHWMLRPKLLFLKILRIHALAIRPAIVKVTIRKNRKKVLDYKRGL